MRRAGPSRRRVASAVTRAIRFEDEAEQEYRAAARWYDDQRAGLGTEFLDTVDATAWPISFASQVQVCSCLACPPSCVCGAHLSSASRTISSNSTSRPKPRSECSLSPTIVASLVTGKAGCNREHRCGAQALVPADPLLGWPYEAVRQEDVNLVLANIGQHHVHLLERVGPSARSLRRFHPFSFATAAPTRACAADRQPGRCHARCTVTSTHGALHGATGCM